MASATPDTTTIALQLEAAAAQIRALSSLPEAQRGGAMQQAIDAVKTKVDRMEETVKKLKSEVQSLRATTENRMKAVEAHVHNDKQRMYNKNIITVDEPMRSLHDVQTNAEIPSFPRTVRAVFALTESQMKSVGSALGWDFGVPVVSHYNRSFLLQVMGYGGTVPMYL